MSAKQSNSRDKLNIKRITVCALFVAVCLIATYLESLLSLGIAVAVPGVKLGLSNAVALTLVCMGNKKEAWFVNITRICLSSLLFGSVVSFMFAITGGVASLAAVCILSRFKSVSQIGISIAVAVVHNIFQCIVAIFFVGKGIVFYLPILLIGGAVCGAFCGVLVKLFLKKVKTNAIF